ncbi:MAG: tRNA pseudouridine(55) synthase TruB [Gammaproteobacteria bacterium]|nr:MAG: tRNA pseudouridine(55) synthase TruB [Gammaproteobacteria bacterium]
MNEKSRGQSGHSGQYRRKNVRDVNGILILDKPVGMTSNRVLQKVKNIYGARKAGHTGSLDPLASGMLPLCFGQATKVSHWLLDADKVYEVEAFIGTRTDTADADGQMVATSECTRITPEMLATAMASHRGEIDQVPPMYSALKQSGRRLYELAREGKEVERKARRVNIYDLEVIRFDPCRPVLRVRCSKGTYIRTLVETLAEAMGTLAHVAALRRIALGPFATTSMVTLEQISALAEDRGALDKLLIPADTALERFPAVELTADEAFYLRRGHPVGHASQGLSGLVRIYDQEARFMGIGEIQPEGAIAPKRLFVGA